MRRGITVTSAEEGRLIEAGLADPQTRAFVKVVGALRALSPDAQARALRWAEDYFRCQQRRDAAVALDGHAESLERV